MENFYLYADVEYGKPIQYTGRDGDYFEIIFGRQDCISNMITILPRKDSDHIVKCVRIKSDSEDILQPDIECDEKYYQIKFKIPWEYTGATPKEGKTLCFDINVLSEKNLLSWATQRYTTSEERNKYGTGNKGKIHLVK